MDAPLAHLQWLSPEQLEYLRRHITLHPKIFGKDDCSADNANALVRAFVDSLRAFEKETDGAHHLVVQNAAIMMEHTLAARNLLGYIDGKSLADILKKITAPGGSGSVALEICAQNAGLLIAREGDVVRIEAFTLAPPNQAVYEGTGRIHRKFPEQAAEISIDSSSSGADTRASGNHRDAVTAGGTEHGPYIEEGGTKQARN
jgi:hypothetical protein